MNHESLIMNHDDYRAIQKYSHESLLENVEEAAYKRTALERRASQALNTASAMLSSSTSSLSSPNRKKSASSLSLSLPQHKSVLGDRPHPTYALSTGTTIGSNIESAYCDSRGSKGGFQSSTRGHDFTSAVKNGYSSSSTVQKQIGAIPSQNRRVEGGDGIEPHLDGSIGERELKGSERDFGGPGQRSSENINSHRENHEQFSSSSKRNFDHSLISSSMASSSRVGEDGIKGNSASRENGGVNRYESGIMSFTRGSPWERPEAKSYFLSQSGYKNELASDVPFFISVARHEDKSRRAAQLVATVQDELALAKKVFMCFSVRLCTTFCCSCCSSTFSLFLFFFQFLFLFQM